MKSSLMGIKRIVMHGVTNPFGDHRTVNQAFPAAISAKEADPFLMCDYFNVVDDSGPAKHPDDFPVGWHPHRGFDICSYFKSGIGRHGDSLGNRESFETPGMQWMSTGSGVEHAEGGGEIPDGVPMIGMQIWVNVPADKKMDDPRYGTVPSKGLPLVQIEEGVMARVLAGPGFGTTGPFETVQPVQMIDFELEASCSVCMDMVDGMDTAILYVYEGELKSVNSHTQTVEQGNIVLLDAESSTNRGLEFATGSSSSAKAILFSGKKLQEPIAWHGPIVMNTQEQIRETFREIRNGKFPPVRVDWDYKRISSKPS